MITKIKELFNSLIESVRGITWPTGKQMLKASLAVLIISVIIGGYLLLLDALFLDLRSTLIN